MHPDGAPNGTNANDDTCTTDAQPTPTAMLADRRILLFVCLDLTVKLLRAFPSSK